MDPKTISSFFEENKPSPVPTFKEWFQAVSDIISEDQARTLLIASGSKLPTHAGTTTTGYYVTNINGKYYSYNGNRKTLSPVNEVTKQVREFVAAS